MWLPIDTLAEKNVYNYKINNDFFDHEDHLSCPDLATCHISGVQKKKIAVKVTKKFKKK